MGCESRSNYMQLKSWKYIEQIWAYIYLLNAWFSASVLDQQSYRIHQKSQNMAYGGSFYGQNFEKNWLQNYMYFEMVDM